MLGITLDQQVVSLVGGPVATVAPLATLQEAASILSDEMVGVLLVGHPEDVIGILSERDLVRAMGDGEDPSQQRVRDQMTDQVESVPAGTSIRRAAELMLRDEIRHLVVVEAPSRWASSHARPARCRPGGPAGDLTREPGREYGDGRATADA